MPEIHERSTKHINNVFYEGSRRLLTHDEFEQLTSQIA